MLGSCLSDCPPQRSAGRLGVGSRCRSRGAVFIKPGKLCEQPVGRDLNRSLDFLAIELLPFGADVVHNPKAEFRRIRGASQLANPGERSVSMLNPQPQ